MPNLQLWMPTYDDTAQLAGALESLEPWADVLDVYVVDGRYATFPGETDLTPEAEEICDYWEFVTYTHPPDLPLGDPDAELGLRSPQHEQATWVNYELLDEDAWTMEMDTDERLEEFDIEVLEGLNERRKYSPTVLTPAGERLEPAIRLYQPRWWTFWIDDVSFLRDLYPRNTPLRELFTAKRTTAHRSTGYAGFVDDIVIRNYGQDRPDDYNERRATQLELMKSPAAARAIRDGVYPSTVDLTDYLTDDEREELR